MIYLLTTGVPLEKLRFGIALGLTDCVQLRDVSAIGFEDVLSL